MTLYDYNKLPDDDKFSTVFSEGQFLNHLVKGTKSYSLYALGKFFVEIEYKISENKIIGQRSFKTGSLLDKHTRLNKLDGINLMEPEDSTIISDENILHAQAIIDLAKGQPANKDLLSETEIFKAQLFYEVKQHNKLKERIKVEQKRQDQFNSNTSRLIKDYRYKRWMLWGIIVIEFIFILMML